MSSYYEHQQREKLRIEEEKRRVGWLQLVGSSPEDPREDLFTDARQSP